MAKSRLKLFGALSMIFLILENKIANRPIKIVVPIKPNFSAYIANMESFAASGRYP